MSSKTTGGILTDVYRSRIGEPKASGEVRGYWVFLTGLVLGTLGLVLFIPSSTATGSGFTLRELSIFLAAVGLVMLVAGPVIRLPLESWASYAAYAGQAVAFLAAVWFLLVFPGDWSVQTGNQPTILLYAVGLAIVTVGGVVGPLLTESTADDLEAGEGRAAQLEAELAAVREECDRLEDQLEEARGEGESAREEGAAAEEALAAAREETTAAEAAGAELQGLLDSLQASKARFELYEDRGEEWRWRLRHSNGNTIATSGQGYTRRHNAQRGLESVRANALGATLLLVEDEAELPEEDEAFEPVEDADSRATFELYEDGAGEHRWRLRHDNGNLVADSGEGYSSKRGAKEALGKVQEYAGPGEYLRVDPTAFEIYRDAGGEWRWRLVHRNGNVLADSGQGYTRRRDARRAVDRISDDIEDMAFEVYEDSAGEYRWRLESGGNVVGDSGEGYDSKSGAEEAVGRVTEYAPGADALDVGWAAFEVFEDSAGEYRWRLRHRNGNVMADGGQGYASRSGAHDAVDRFKLNAPAAPTEEQ
jgi:uncharacterized protein YegP (UPF0339 family)